MADEARLLNGEYGWARENYSRWYNAWKERHSSYNRALYMADVDMIEYDKLSPTQRPVMKEMGPGLRVVATVELKHPAEPINDTKMAMALAMADDSRSPMWMLTPHVGSFGSWMYTLNEAAYFLMRGHRAVTREGWITMQATGQRRGRALELALTEREYVEVLHSLRGMPEPRYALNNIKPPARGPEGVYLV